MRDSRQVVLLNLDDILPNRFQPRIKFDEKAIVELSESIKEHGVIQPIIVRKISDKYEIIAGERRYKASVMAGKSTIPAIIVDLNDKDSSEIALIENVQRQDLTPIEEAISYRKILDMGYLTQEALATKLGVAQSTIANKLRLLNLDDDVQEALLDGKISERHARSLLKLSKSSMQREMLKRIIDERLTVRKTDEEINNMTKNSETSILDSIENNNNMPAFENNNVSDLSKNDNPFIIDNNVTETPVSSNIEILDFGFEEINPDMEYRKLDSAMDTEETANVPSNPIIEDEEQDSGQLVEPFSNLEESNKIDTPTIINETIKQPEEDIHFNNQSLEIENDNQTISNQIGELTNESKPAGRFFTMFSPSYEEEKTADEVASTQATSENSNIFNSQIEADIPQEINNSVSPEIEIPDSNIFNTNPIFEQQPIENYNIPVAEEHVAIDNSTFTSEQSEIPNINMEMPEVPIQPVSVPSSTPTLRDIISKIRKCADEIEAVGFEIDTEEYDFDDIYQVIFKIKK